MKTTAAFGLSCVLIIPSNVYSDDSPPNGNNGKGPPGSLEPVARNAVNMLTEGRKIFRSDTFGDEAFWGDQLQLHLAIKGTNFGGVGPGISPRTALELGLKVDGDALPQQLIQRIKRGDVDLDDPAVTLQLLKLNAVVGVKGFFNRNGSLQSVGLTCAVCHSTVNNNVTFGIGDRLDGFANRDLNTGAIIAAAPNLSPITSLLSIVYPGITDDQMRGVLSTWGPGKFDAQLLLDGKAFNPQQITGGIVTGTNVSGATLIPNAFGLAGFNLHTWTGGWGTVSYWNAFVAVLELRGIGTFFDERLDNTNKYPIAATARFGHISVPPDEDQVTSKLPALHYYQLSLPAPNPRAGVDYNAAAARRGRDLFVGKADCNSCHRQPLLTEPGWNDHTPAQMKIDSFQADRSPGETYKTMNLAGLFIRERGLFMNPENKGRFYHDGRFQTLRDVVASYNSRFGLGLSDSEENDLVEYLKSL